MFIRLDTRYIFKINTVTVKINQSKATNVEQHIHKKVTKTA